MRKIHYFILTLFLCGQLQGQTLSSKSNTEGLTEFKNFIDTIGLVFDIPKDYQATAVIDNPDLWYGFAIINKDSSMQIRYTVWALKPRLIEYEESLKHSNVIMINPNKLYNGIIQANILNMTGGKMYNIGAFPQNAVKQEFNADDGGSCFFEFNCKFGKGYKYGHFVYLHKDNIADVIITYMDNDKIKHKELMELPFHALRFKK